MDVADPGLGIATPGCAESNRSTDGEDGEATLGAVAVGDGGPDPGGGVSSPFDFSSSIDSAEPLPDTGGVLPRCAASVPYSRFLKSSDISVW